MKHDYRGERNNVYLISCHSSPFFGRSGPPPLKDQQTSSHLYNTSYSEVVFWWTIIFFFSRNLAYLEAVKNITQFFKEPFCLPCDNHCFIGLSSTYNCRQIVETLYSHRVTSENIRIHSPPLSPPFKVGVFVVF